MKKALAGALVAASTLGVIGTGALVSYLHKEPILAVDGVETQLGGFYGDVEDVLNAQGIELGEHDVVIPSLETGVEDGDIITVNYARPLELVVDGVSTTYWVTENNLAAALATLGFDTNNIGASHELSSAVSRDGLRVEIRMPKAITVTADGTTHEVNSTAPTVADALVELNITLDEDDRLSPEATTPLTADLAITVQRVSVEEVTRTEEIPFETTETKDDTLDKGTTEVDTEGVVGERSIVERITTVDGQVESTEEISNTVVTEPVTKEVRVGTKTSTPSTDGGGSGSGGSSGSGNTAIDLSREAMWDRIAQCESSGNWSINTGNGYYGGLQFNLPTWRSVNGQDFAEYPHQASREEQITVANRLYAIRGTQPWSCA